MWSDLQPQFNLTMREPTQLCISFNTDLKNSSTYGWKLNACEEELNVICQTFGCLQGTKTDFFVYP
jgi:hypothetical protein